MHQRYYRQTGWRVAKAPNWEVSGSSLVGERVSGGGEGEGSGDASGDGERVASGDGTDAGEGEGSGEAIGDAVSAKALRGLCYASTSREALLCP